MIVEAHLAQLIEAHYFYFLLVEGNKLMEW